MQEKVLFFDLGVHMHCRGSESHEYESNYHSQPAASQPFSVYLMMTLKGCTFGWGIIALVFAN